MKDSFIPGAVEAFPAIQRINMTEAEKRISINPKETIGALMGLLEWFETLPEAPPFFRGLKSQQRAIQERHPLYRAYKAAGREMP